MGIGNLTLDAKTEALGAATRFIAEALAAASCPREVAAQIELAVEEVFMNIARYGYGGEPGKVEITVGKADARAPQTVRITIRDDGRPFNPLLAKDPDIHAPLEERAVGGLGIFLVKNIMSSVTYAYKNGRNHLMMSKTW